jgi:hypothetical protein
MTSFVSSSVDKRAMARSTITKDPVSEQDKFMLRLPEGMRKRIKAAADRNGRSMNAEIVATLDETYGTDDFDFPTFMEKFMVPVVNASSEDERKHLLQQANDFLMMSDSDMEVLEGMNANGTVEVFLKSNGVRFTVGTATELTFTDDK